MPYKYYNANALGLFKNDCVVRATSLATDKSWDYTYHYLSDLAQQEGTMMDDKDFVEDFLNTNFIKIKHIPETVGEVAKAFPKNILLITMRGHIVCARYGTIFDSFDCTERKAEQAWIVK